MKKFEFREHGYPVELDIAGHAFMLTVTKATAKKLEEYGKEAQRMGAELPETPAGLEQAWWFMAESLDGLLGADATDTIFAGRDRDLLDIVDVMTYVCGEVESAAKQQEGTPVPPTVPDTKAQTVEQALRIMQNPDVMAAVTKAMGK